VVADGESLEKKTAPRLHSATIESEFRGSFSGYERDCLFYNGDGPSKRLYNQAYLFGLDFDDDGRCAVPADMDGDGDLDLVTFSLQALRMIENTAPRRSFARIRLEAAKTERRALGAIVKVTAGGVTQQDHVKVTEGFTSQVPLDVHFGLRDAKEISGLEILWPSGEKQSFGTLPVDRLISVREGDLPKIAEVPRWPAPASSRAKPEFTFDIAAERIGAGREPISEKGRATVINFWSPTCVPCKEELPELAALAGKDTHSARMVGVSVEVSDPAAVEAAAKALGVPYPQYLANDELVRSFFGPGREVILPSTFVFDAQGRLQRAFTRPVTAAELEPLLSALSEKAVPFEYLKFRGISLVYLTRYEEGLKLLRRVEVMRPNDESVQLAIGEAALKLGRDGESLTAYAAAVRIEPNSARARYNYGELLRRVGRHVDAIEQYEEALRLRGEDAGTLFSLADAAAAAGQYPRAMDAFERALKLEPRKIALWKAKAQLHALLKQFDQAKAALEKAREIDPKDPGVLKALSELR
jgi:tetratricopeptide (TPR) repeat protein